MTTHRIGTFNLLHGVAVNTISTDSAGNTGSADSADSTAPPTAPPDRSSHEQPHTDVRMLRAAADVIDADVLGLQEVDRLHERSALVDQTAAVADALRAPHWRFVPTVTDAGGGSAGIGLVSRLPVLTWQVRRFAAAPVSLPLMVPGDPRPRLVRVPDEPRAALAAVIDGPRGPFTVVTAHLSFVPGVNVRQLRRLTHWASGLPRPVLLAGDLNLPGPLPRLVTGWTSLAKAATYPSMRPTLQFDHVLAHGLPDHTRASVVTRSHRLAVSDHCALTIDLDLDLDPAAGP